MTRAKKLPHIHPGEILQEEFLDPFDISRYRLAKEIHVPMTRIAEICQGKRSISADTALRLARFFGNSAKFWLGLQEDFDLEQEATTKARELATIRSHDALLAS